MKKFIFLSLFPLMLIGKTNDEMEYALECMQIELDIICDTMKEIMCEITALNQASADLGHRIEELKQEIEK